MPSERFCFCSLCSVDLGTAKITERRFKGCRTVVNLDRELQKDPHVPRTVAVKERLAVNQSG
jgi:hypothetical protein